MAVARTLQPRGTAKAGDCDHAPGPAPCQKATRATVPPRARPASPVSPGASASSRSTLTVPVPPPPRRGPMLDHAVAAVAPAPGEPGERPARRCGRAPHCTPSTGPGPEPDVPGATAVIRRTVHAVVARARLRTVVTVRQPDSPLPAGARVSGARSRDHEGAGRPLGEGVGRGRPRGGERP